MVVYATIETKFQIGKNLPKTLCKNSPKNPWQKSMAKIFNESLTKNLTKI